MAASQRNPHLPNVPSLAEGGYKGVDLANWFAVYAPAGTPIAVVKNLTQHLFKSVTRLK